MTVNVQRSHCARAAVITLLFTVVLICLTSDPAHAGYRRYFEITGWGTGESAEEALVNATMDADFQLLQAALDNPNHQIVEISRTETVYPPGPEGGAWEAEVVIGYMHDGSDPPGTPPVPPPLPPLPDP